jgi:glycosyltransferase involved in cell wall biosynthesis
MSGILVLDFTGAEDHARTLVEEAVGPGDATLLRPTALLDDLLRRKPLPSRSHLIVVGAPPRDGIGYGIVPFLAMALRPRTVTLLDSQSRTATSMSLARFVTTTAPFGASQLMVSGLAVAGQRIVANPRLLSADTEGSRDGALRRMLYLFPLVGIGAPVGGAVTHAHSVLQALNDLDVAVDGYTSDPGMAATAAAQVGFPTHWHVIRPPRLTKALPASTAFGLDLALARATRRVAVRCDLVYQRHTRFSLAGSLAARVARAPLFLEFNSPAEFFHPRATLLAGQRQRCEDAGLFSATRVFVVSTAAKALLVDRGLPEERIVVNPNGVEIERFASGRSSAAVRRRLGFSHDDVVLGFVGSFMSFHGSPILAEAFLELARAFPNVRLLLVGDGDERPRVATMLGELVHERRVVMTGRVPPSDIPPYLGACDVLVSPHVPLRDDMPFFGSPTKLFEYMAAGKAIAASRLGQIAEILDHERTGLLVEPGDPKALVVALKRLSADANLRHRLGRNARAEARDYTWVANAQRIVDTFRSLPGAKGSQRRRRRT